MATHYQNAVATKAAIMQAYAQTNEAEEDEEDFAIICKLRSKNPREGTFPG